MDYVVWAILVNGDWFYVGDDRDDFVDAVYSGQCDNCGGWAIERVDDHYTCGDFVADDVPVRGCGHNFYPELKPEFLVCWP